MCAGQLTFHPGQQASRPQAGAFPSLPSWELGSDQAQSEPNLPLPAHHLSTASDPVSPTRARMPQDDFLSFAAEQHLRTASDPVMAQFRSQLALPVQTQPAPGQASPVAAHGNPLAQEFNPFAAQNVPMAQQYNSLSGQHAPPSTRGSGHFHPSARQRTQSGGLATHLSQHTDDIMGHGTQASPLSSRVITMPSAEDSDDHMDQQFDSLCSQAAQALRHFHQLQSESEQNFPREDELDPASAGDLLVPQPSTGLAASASASLGASLPHDESAMQDESMQRQLSQRSSDAVQQHVSASFATNAPIGGSYRVPAPLTLLPMPQALFTGASLSTPLQEAGPEDDLEVASRAFRQAAQEGLSNLAVGHVYIPTSWRLQLYD